MSDSWHNSAQQAYPSIAEAARFFLQELRRRLPLDGWYLHRLVGDRLYVLQAEDHGYGQQPGNSLPWMETLCQQMVQGHGPNVAPCAPAVACYARAPLARRLRIETYVGYALHGRDGELIGTLCGIDPRPSPPSIRAHAAYVAECARALALLMSLELGVQTARRELLVQRWRQTPALPGADVWEQTLAHESASLEGLYGPATVLRTRVLAGTPHGAASTLRELVHDGGLVAHTGSAEIGTLLWTSTAGALPELVQQVRAALHRRAIQARLGAAAWHPGQSLFDTYEHAGLALA